MNNKRTKFILKEPNKFPITGIGVEWDNNISNNNANSTLTGKQEFELITKRLKILNVKYVRLFWWLSDVIKNKETFCYNEEHVKDILEELEYCKKNDISVCLTVNANVLSCKFDENGNPISGFDAEDYVYCTLKLLDYLLIEKKLTCIKEITPFNEPNWVFKNVTYSNYKDICIKLNIGLKNKPYGDKIKLNYLDTSNLDGLKLFYSLTEKMGDMYSVHDYSSYSYDDNELISLLPKITQVLIKDENKPFVVNEFGWADGCTSFSQDNEDSFERGLFLIRKVIAYLCAGASGCSYWCYYNCFYGKGGPLMSMGLFKSNEENFELRPLYYSYGLVMNYILKGAKVYSLKHTDTLMSVAVNNPDKSWSYLIVNSGDKKEKFSFVNRYAVNLKFNRYVYRKESLPSDEKMIKKDLTVKALGKTLKGEIEPNTFVLYNSSKEIE